MTFLLRFMLSAAVVFLVVDSIPFPNFPPGLISQMISQTNSDNTDDAR